jgi:protein TonB
MGIDLAKVAMVKTPAKPIGDTREWISYTDYPASAVAANLQGTSTIVWTIGVDGRVGKCSTVHSAGAKILDDAACHALKRRARYTPAKDAQGQPIESVQTRKAIWALSEG